MPTNKCPALVAFTTGDLDDEEVTLLQKKLDALVDDVRYRRLPVANVEVLVLRPNMEGLVFVWGEDLAAEEVDPLQSKLHETFPDGKFLVSNFSFDATSLNNEEIVSFIRVLQEHLGNRTATTAEQDALESLRVSANRFSHLRDAPGSVRVVIEDLHPDVQESDWRVTFRAGDEVVWSIEPSTLQEAAEISETLVDGLERNVLSRADSLS